MIFFVFDKHKNNIVVLLTLDKSKKIKASQGKSLSYPYKTPLGKTGCLSNPYFLLTDCLGIQFFDSFPFPSTVS